MEQKPIQIEIGEGRNIPRHRHTGLEIFLVIKGAVCLDIDGCCFNMKSEDIIVINSGETHAIVRNNPNIIFRIYLSEKFINEEAEMASGFRVACNSVKDSENKDAKYFTLKRTVTQLMLSYYQTDKNSKLAIKTALLNSLHIIFTDFMEKQSPLPTQTNERLDNIINYIHSHFRHAISLQDIADLEHISIHYLSRLFKKKMNVGFIDYLNQVRLKSAVDDLVMSKDTVLKIAMNNGFSNVGSFSRIFIKTYGDSPAKYRSKQSVETLPEGISELVGFDGNSEDIVKFIHMFDIKYQNGVNKLTEYRINASTSGTKLVKPLEKVIRIGLTCELLKVETRAQLEQLKSEILFQYVHFQCLFEDGLYPYKDKGYSDHEYTQVFDYLFSLRIIPILSFNVNYIFEQDGDEFILQNSTKKLISFLRGHISRYGMEYIKKWKFEIFQPVGADLQLLLQKYSLLHRSIRSVLPNASVGVSFVDTSKENEYNLMLNFMQNTNELGNLPEFIYFYADSTTRFKTVHNDDYIWAKHYNVKCVQRLQNYLIQAGCPCPPVLLMEWNILSGYTTAESNTFYRAALFVDEFIELEKHEIGMACWLNTYIYESSTKTADFSSLALFLYAKIKRPLFFAVQLMDMLYNEIIYQNKYILATRSSQGDLAILVLNPCFFDPQYAWDESLCDTHKRTLVINIEGVHGAYIVERFNIDQDQGAIYSKWANMGFPALNNPNTVDYLERNLSAGYSVLEEQINGPYKISLDMRFNAVAVYIIREHIIFEPNL